MPCERGGDGFSVAPRTCSIAALGSAGELQTCVKKGVALTVLAELRGVQSL